MESVEEDYDSVPDILRVVRKAKKSPSNHKSSDRDGAPPPPPETKDGSPPGTHTGNNPPGEASPKAKEAKPRPTKQTSPSGTEAVKELERQLQICKTENSMLRNGFLRHGINKGGGEEDMTTKILRASIDEKNHTIDDLRKEIENQKLRARSEHDGAVLMLKDDLARAERHNAALREENSDLKRKCATASNSFGHQQLNTELERLKRRCEELELQKKDLMMELEWTRAERDRIWGKENEGERAVPVSPTAHASALNPAQLLAETEQLKRDLARAQAEKRELRTWIQGLEEKGRRRTEHPATGTDGDDATMYQRVYQEIQGNFEALERDAMTSLDQYARENDRLKQEVQGLQAGLAEAQERLRLTTVELQTARVEADHYRNLYSTAATANAGTMTGIAPTPAVSSPVQRPVRDVDAAVRTSPQAQYLREQASRALEEAADAKRMLSEHMEECGRATVITGEGNQEYVQSLQREVDRLRTSLTGRADPRHGELVEEMRALYRELDATRQKYFANLESSVKKSLQHDADSSLQDQVLSLETELSSERKRFDELKRETESANERLTKELTSLKGRALALEGERDSLSAKMQEHLLSCNNQHEHLFRAQLRHLQAEAKKNADIARHHQLVCKDNYLESQLQECMDELEGLRLRLAGKEPPVDEDTMRTQLAKAKEEARVANQKLRDYLRMSAGAEGPQDIQGSVPALIEKEAECTALRERIMELEEKHRLEKIGSTYNSMSRAAQDETGLAAAERQLQDALKDVEAAKAKYREAVVDFDADRDRNKAQISALQTKLSAATAAKEEAEERAKMATETVFKIEPAYQSLKTEYDNLSATMAKYGKDKRELDEEIEALRKERKFLLQDIEGWRVKATEAANCVKEVEPVLRKAQTDNAILADLLRKAQGALPIGEEGEDTNS